MRTFRAVLIGMFLVLIGLFCIASIGLFIPGVICIILSGVPFANIQRDHVYKNLAKEGIKVRKPNEPHTDEPIPPWVMELEKNDQIGNVIPMPIRDTGRSRQDSSGISYDE